MENEEVKGQLLVSNGALHASDNRENGFHKHNTSAMEANGRHRQQWARETEFILAVRCFEIYNYLATCNYVSLLVLVYIFI